jgi:hypothetical protein
MGESAEEKAVITAWQRISERNGFYAVMEAAQFHARPEIAGAAGA